MCAYVSCQVVCHVIMDHGLRLRNSWWQQNSINDMEMLA